MTHLEVLFTPADFAALQSRDLSQTVCVVFDVLRATSTMVTALANGANAIIPVETIEDAVALRQRQPEVLLAGERNGLRIPASLAGGVPFDLGNSPREFTPGAVAGKTIVMTTTNGTRALRACAHARQTLLGAFLNLTATAEFIRGENPAQLLLVCSGTGEEAAYEDVLGAGALCDLLRHLLPAADLADSAHLARRLYQIERLDLMAALGHSRNARRLLGIPELRADVPFCLENDRFDLVARLGESNSVTRVI